MNNRDLREYNAQPVLERLETLIEANSSRKIDDIYDDLSIFDWWPERLNVNHMKQMRAFLKEAIKLGYTGYVCFKVGASGCANGMWAHKEESTNGYSPEGDCLYRSFTPDYTYWQVKVNNRWLPGDNRYNEIKNKFDLELLLSREGLL